MTKAPAKESMAKSTQSRATMYALSGRRRPKFALGSSGASQLGQQAFGSSPPPVAAAAAAGFFRASAVGEMVR